MTFALAVCCWLTLSLLLRQSFSTNIITHHELRRQGAVGDDIANERLKDSFQNWCLQGMHAVQTCAFKNTSATNLFALDEEKQKQCLSKDALMLLQAATSPDGYDLLQDTVLLYIGGHKDALVGRQMREANEKIIRMTFLSHTQIFSKIFRHNSMTILLWC